MRPFHAYKRLVIASLLGLAGMGAAPAAAQEPPKLLFLGISKDGRPYQAAERAIKRRIEGLEVKVEQPAETAPPCEQAGCLSAALVTAHVEVGLTGRIRQNDRACLATLWFVGGKDKEKPIEHDIACRPDGKEDLLVANLADGAAEMMNDYLRDKEPPPAETNSKVTSISNVEKQEIVRENKHWGWKRKTAVAGLSLLLAVGIVGTGYFAALDKTNAPFQVECPGDPSHMCQPVYDFGTYKILSSTLTSSTAVALLFTIGR